MLCGKGSSSVYKTECRGRKKRKRQESLTQANAGRIKLGQTKRKEGKRGNCPPHHDCWWAVPGTLYRQSWRRAEEQDSEPSWSSGRCFLLSVSHQSRWRKARHCCSYSAHGAPSGCTWWMLTTESWPIPLKCRKLTNEPIAFWLVLCCPSLHCICNRTVCLIKVKLEKKL